LFGTVENLKNRVKWIWFRLARWGCRVFFVTLFFRLRVYGLENIPADSAFVLISNHQSFLDPLIYWVLLKRHLYFLARNTLFANKFVNLFMSSLEMISIKRGEADLKAIRMVLAKFSEGNGVCLFPEGTRTPDGRIANFKPGFGLLCKKGDVPVVPVVIDGAFECWPKHHKIFRPGSKIVITYGKAITAEQIKGMSNMELATSLTSTLRRMQNECRIKQGKEPYNY